MKATELRIGNLVSIPSAGVIAKVEMFNNISVDIETSDIDLNEDDSNFMMNEVNGIELTEEWLRKLGFKDNSYRDYFLYHPVADYAIISISFRYNTALLSDITSISVDDHDLNLNCRYLHQLQNLYFALTGEELEVKNG